jgi:alkanesulfonate monooxygenase SsuD/methylene tetrahydromethanopterin reductase-like flavin-dependent oxidoreductase (luciferase family)
LRLNYSHRLRFGLIASSASAETVTQRGTLADALGYDLVTVDDSSELDPWAALSWLAGRTERIRLLPIVSIGRHSPAVLGRAAASLDLLSGGRLQLGLTGDDAADISEAIEIIREIWAVDAPGRLRHGGSRYSVNGAERGPAPDHDVPILVRGLGERMLRLAGSASEGWLVRYPAALESGNSVVDASAQDAGRDPREIRRVLDIDPVDGTPAEWVAQLLPLVTDHGVGTFLLRTDDPAMIRHFITAVVPALRDAADTAIPGLSSSLPVRPAAALARRAPGIDYDDVPPSLTVVEPGDMRYSSVHSTYLRGGSPGIVLRPRTVEQVTDAVAFARRHPEVPLGIRSGGHGISGRSTNRGGIVIDVSALNSIDILDRSTRRVRVGAGATWAEVASALEPFGWAISSGDYGGVGVGGLATAGGIGFLGRAHGLTIDHLRAVEVVLADGRMLRASDTENADLFWALRGAGANFGVATSFEFEAAEVPAVGWAQLVFDASDTAEFLVKWGETLEASPRDTTSFLILGGGSDGNPPIARLFGMVDSTDPDTIIARLQPFAEIAPLYQQSVQLLPYRAALVAPQGPANGGRGEPVSRSGLLEHITAEFAEAAAQLIDSGGSYFFQIRATGGAASDVPADATAYAHRSANFSVVAFGSNAPRLDRQWDALRPYFDGMYLSFETDTDPERIHDAFPPATLHRLRELKATFDPENLFRDNFPIVPAAHQEMRTP